MLIPYMQKISTRHGQDRWVVDVRVGGVLRRQEFAHPLAAEDAIVLAGRQGELGVAPAVILAALRLLAYETLEGEGELSRCELDRLEVLNRHAASRARDRR